MRYVALTCCDRLTGVKTYWTTKRQTKTKRLLHGDYGTKTKLHVYHVHERCRHELNSHTLLLRTLHTNAAFTNTGIPNTTVTHTGVAFTGLARLLQSRSLCYTRPSGLAIAARTNTSRNRKCFHLQPCQAWIRELSSFFVHRSCNRHCREHWTPRCYYQEHCYPKLLRYRLEHNGNTAAIPKTYRFELSTPHCCQDLSRGALPLLLMGTTTMLSQTRFQGLLVSPASVNIGWTRQTAATTAGPGTYVRYRTHGHNLRSP